MSDWKDGDLALCIKGGQMNLNEPANGDYPVRGKIYKVRAFGEEHFYGGILPALWFYDAPINQGHDRVWTEERFIKVTPEDEDEFDREVIEKLKDDGRVTVKVTYGDNPFNKPFDLDIKKRPW